MRGIVNCSIEVVSKSPLEPNLGVGEKRLILERKDLLFRIFKNELS